MTAQKCARAWVRLVRRRVVEEHFIGHDGHFPRGANFREFGGFARLDERAGGIVRMHDEHGAGTRRERRAQRGEIDLPAVIVEQRVGNETNVGEVRQKFKERIAGRGNQNFVSRFAQQTENMAVGFAGSRGEQDAFRDRLR